MNLEASNRKRRRDNTLAKKHFLLNSVHDQLCTASLSANSDAQTMFKRTNDIHVRRHCHGAFPFVCYRDEFASTGLPVSRHTFALTLQLYRMRSPLISLHRQTRRRPTYRSSRALRPSNIAPGKMSMGLKSRRLFCGCRGNAAGDEPETKLKPYFSSGCLAWSTTRQDLSAKMHSRRSSALAKSRKLRRSETTRAGFYLKPTQPATNHWQCGRRLVCLCHHILC